MSSRVIPKPELLEALRTGPGDAVLPRCLEVIEGDSRDTYSLGGTPARIMLESLSIKFRHATSGGKTIVGGAELLSGLRDLGDEFVASIGARQADESCFVYFRRDTLKFVGAIIVRDAA